MQTTTRKTASTFANMLAAVALFVAGISLVLSRAALDRVEILADAVGATKRPGPFQLADETDRNENQSR